MRHRFPSLAVGYFKLSGPPSPERSVKGATEAVSDKGASSRQGRLFAQLSRDVIGGCGEEHKLIYSVRRKEKEKQAVASPHEF